MSAARTTKYAPDFRAALCAMCLSSAGVCFAQTPGTPARLDQEARFVAGLEQATPEQLKAIYIACSDQAAQRLLGFGEAASCSVAYEVLKRRVFGGDFNALLAWSRSVPAASISAPAALATK